jgi:hypothetical protein
MGAITREIAEQEINQWLDCKKINERKRESYKDHIDNLIDSVCDGCLSLGDGNVLIHELKFPIEGEASIVKLEYKPRLKVETIQNHLQGVKPSDPDGRVCAYAAALTSKPKNIIKAMDTEDYSIAQSIVVFFL